MPPGNDYGATAREFAKVAEGKKLTTSLIDFDISALHRFVEACEAGKQHQLDTERKRIVNCYTVLEVAMSYRLPYTLYTSIPHQASSTALHQTTMTPLPGIDLVRHCNPIQDVFGQEILIQASKLSYSESSSRHDFPSKLWIARHQSSEGLIVSLVARTVCHPR